MSISRSYCKKMLSSITIAVVLVSVFVAVVNISMIPPAKADPDWLTGWQYRKSHVINGAAGAGTDYQVEITVYYGAPVLGAWTVKAPIPTGVGDSSCSVCNGKIYVIGGYGVSPSDYRNDVQVYDPLSNTWTSKTGMPTARWGPMAVCGGSKIYVFGGLTSAGMTNKLEVYDPASDTWDTTKSSMPYSMRCGGCVYDPDNGLIYLIGGNNGPQLNTMFSYNPSSDTYDTSLTNCPEAVEGATCAYKEGKIYAIGGLDDSQSVAENRDLKVNRVYTIASDSWSTMTDAPERREGQSGYSGISIIGDYVYYTHGMRRGSVYQFYKTTFRYQISTDSWVQLADANYERDGVASATVNGKLYVIAGRMNTHGLTYVEEFDPTVVPGDSGNSVYLNGHCRADFGDVRFTSGDGATLLDYWIESEVDGDHATFWVEVKDDLGSAQTIYIYYGKSDATTTSNGDNTFLFFDHFLGNSLDTTKWDQMFSPTVTVSSSVASVSQTTQSAALSRIQGKTGFGTCAFRTSVMFQYPSTGTQWSQAGLANSPAPIPDGCWFEDTGNSLLTIARSVLAGGSVSAGSISYVPNTFQVYEVAYQPNVKAKYYSNDALKDTETTNVPNGPVYPMLAVYNNLELTTYSDWALVRKYVDPEPSQATWGSEEYRPPAVLFIDPPSVTKTPSDVGTYFTVSVNIGSVTDLFGFEIKITWDNTLITFASLDNSPLNTIWPQGFFEPLNPSPPPGYQTGPGYVRYAALATGGSGFTGSGTLFTVTFLVKRVNFPATTSIHFGAVKLSDSYMTAIIATLTDGQYAMGAAGPDLEFALANPNPSKPFEYCKTFEVEVYATHVTDMTDFDLTVLFNSELLKFTGIDYWGVFGTGQTSSTAGSVEVWNTAGASHTGDSLLLFALTFHVEFTDDANHIWTTNTPNDLTATVSIKNDVGDLSFVQGPIPITGITLPTPLTITIHLIRGDVNCDGKVDVFDLRTVAAYYDKTSTDPQWPTISKYDLKTDNTIDIFDLVIIATNYGYYNPP